MQPEFMKKHTAIEQENIIMPEILRIMKDMGGHAKTSEIIQEMKLTSKTVPEDYIDFERISAKSKRKYRPFIFQFNWSMKNLEFSNFITKVDKKTWEFTEKGRNVDYKSIDIAKDIRSISSLVWEQKSKNNENSKQQECNEEIDTSDSSPTDSWRIELQEKLMAFSPTKFELFARRLVKEMGVDIDETIGVQVSNDGGLDGYGYITSDDFRTARVAIQAKRWEGNVSSPEIDKFRGAMDKYNAEFGIFITTSDFTKAAIEASRIGTRVITLINGDKIADLVEKYELYIEPVTTYTLGEFYKNIT